MTESIAYNLWLRLRSMKNTNTSARVSLFPLKLIPNSLSCGNSLYSKFVYHVYHSLEHQDHQKDSYINHNSLLFSLTYVEGWLWLRHIVMNVVTHNTSWWLLANRWFDTREGLLGRACLPKSSAWASLDWSQDSGGDRRANKHRAISCYLPRFTQTQDTARLTTPT